MRLKFKCMSRAPEMDDPDLAHLTRLIRHPLTGLFYRRRFQAVLNLCDTPIDRVLEIGYGAGFLACVLASEAREYIAVDIHAECEKVAIALAKAGVRNVSCRTGDTRRLDGVEDNSIDLAVSVSCLEHIREQDDVQKEVFRVLKPEGRAVYGLPVRNLITKMCLKVLGYDDSRIHPSGPADVIVAAEKAGLVPDRQTFLPPGLGYRLGLYWAGRFVKSSH